MKKISKNRFNAYVCFIKDPRSSLTHDEILWFENSQQTLLGVVLLDKCDKDYSAVIHKRNKFNQFEFENCMTDFSDIKSAEEWLFDNITKLEKTGVVVKEATNLFQPLYDDGKLHLYFKELAKSQQYSAARNLLSEIVPHFYDVDGNFIEQFQTTGFDSRLWEIFLMCYFNEEGLNINKNYFAPDFLLSNSKQEISLEAVTISKKGVIIPFEDLNKHTDEYIKEQIKNDIPLMYGSSLFDKVNHTDKDGLHYWEYKHTKDKPFVIAIADFHAEFAMSWSAEALVNYLYGQEQSFYHDENGNLVILSDEIKSYKKKNGSEVPAGFFLDPLNENVSAILHSTSGTLAKFNRIGKQCSFGEDNIMMIKGFYYHNPTPNASTPLFATYKVDESSNETWAEGVSVYHNPNAKYPLSLNFFPSAAHHFMEDGEFRSILPNLYVYSTLTQTILVKK